MEEVTNEERKIVLSDFYGKGDHVYEDDLGWREEMKTEYWDCEYGGGCKAIIDDAWRLRRKTEAPKCTSKEVFDYHVVEVGLNLAFYYIDDDTFYGIHSEQYPIEVKILPRDRSKKYLGWQCEADTHDFGEVIASFDDEHDIWDNLRINGKSLEEVLERSYIMALN